MRRRNTDACCLYLFVRFGIFRQQLGRKYLSHPRSWPEQASQVTLLSVQVVEMALTNAGSHGTSAEPKQSRLPAIKKKQTRSGRGRLWASLQSQPGHQRQYQQPPHCPQEPSKSRPRVSSYISVSTGPGHRGSFSTLPPSVYSYLDTA